MPTPFVHSLRARINAAIGDAPPATADVALQAHYAKYLCVLASGYLEAAVERVLASYSEAHADQRVARAAARFLDKMQNPTAEHILQTVGAFDHNWRESIESFISGERKDAINSIVANKNLVAHGSQSGVTLGSFKQWFEKADEVIREIETTCT